MDSLKFSISKNQFISDVLGMNVALISAHHEDPPSINTYNFENLLFECKRLSLDLVSIRINAERVDLVMKFQSLGFRVIENLITLNTRLLKSEDNFFPPEIRQANEKDESILRQLAATAFSFDRFHKDPEINSALADQLKSDWIANALNGRSDIVFVYEAAKRIVGFNACLLSGNTASIDLIAVDPKFQGRGVGRQLVSTSQKYYSNFAERMLVGTQSSNISSMNLYHGLGFSVSKSEFTLHGRIKCML